jgi:hypothetical protein
LTRAPLEHALSEIEPIKENPLDVLAAKLKERLPELFRQQDAMMSCIQRPPSYIELPRGIS